MVTLPSVSVLMTPTPLYSRFDGHSRVYLSLEVGREFRTSLSARGAPHRRQETSAILQLRLATAGISGRIISPGRNGSCVGRYMAWIRGMAMRYCTNCGAGVADGQRFCRKCGTPVRTNWPVLSESVESAGNSESPDDEQTEQTE